MATLTLEDVPVNSSFIDNETVYDDKPIHWIVAAKDVDGEGITTLVGYTPVTNKEYDAKEPSNTLATIRDNGNNNYEYSNILQWLNSDKDAGEWYTAQHDADAPPSYEAKAGFLNEFSSPLLDRMRSITKNNVSRRVHLLGWNELGSQKKNTSYDTSYIDAGETYDEYRFDYRAHKYTSGSAINYYRLLLRTKIYSYNDYKVGYAVYNNTAYQLNSSTQEAYTYTYTDAPYVIYVDSTIPVEYNTSNKNFYAKFNVVPTIDVTSSIGKVKKGFDFDFVVNDLYGDTVSVNVYLDNTDSVPIYANESATLGKTITISVDGDIFSGLSLGEHEIIITATDADNNEVSESVSFSKVTNPSIRITSTVGNYISGFTVTFNAEDEDSDPLTVVATVDGNETGTIDGSQLVISDEEFSDLSIGEHTLAITATDPDGNIAEAEATFRKKTVPSITVASDYGTQTTGFNITYTASDADGDSLRVRAYLNGAQIYTATPASGKSVTFNVSPALVGQLPSGGHTIHFTVTDTDGFTAEADTTFIKRSVPVVDVLSYAGQYTGNFDLDYTVSDADGGTFNIKIYLDAKDDGHLIQSGAVTLDTQQTVTIPSAAASKGNHVVYLVVSDDEVKTEAQSTFQRIASAVDSIGGLKVRYKDDAWDSATYPKRVYQQGTQLVSGVQMLTFTDNTPYIDEGTAVNASLLMTVSHSIEGFVSRQMVMNDDGSVTESTPNGIKTTVMNADGTVTETWVDTENNVLKKDIVFNADGSVTEEVYR